MNIVALRKKLKKLFGPLGKDVYLVGGLVRDHLRGVKSNDIDLVFRFNPAEIEKIGFRRVESKSAAPVWIMHHPELGKIEAALPRREVKVGAGTNGFTYETGPEVTLAEDLLRRDFRCNAIAMDLEGGIIDPLHGQRDLPGMILTACSLRAFVEDPLRILRAFRFAADGWTISPELERAIRKHDWTAELAALPSERKLAEMVKAMEKRHPERFFRCLVSYDLDRDCFEEIHSMLGVPAGPAAYRPELFRHACETLEFVASRSDSTVARLAAFFHDLGKIETLGEKNGVIRHIDHEKAGARIVDTLLRRLKAPNELRNAVKAVVLAHTRAQRWPELRDGKRIELAEYALKNGVAEPLRLVAEANGVDMSGFHLALDIAVLKNDQLGLDAKLYTGCLKCGCHDESCRLKKRGGPIQWKERAELLRARKGNLLRTMRDQERQIAVRNRQKLVDTMAALCNSPETGDSAISEALMQHLDAIPELRAMIGLAQDPEHHPEGTVERHSILATTWMLKRTAGLEQARRLELCLAALLHDCGKIVTTTEIDGKIVSRDHAESGDAIINKLFSGTDISGESLERIVSLCHHHMRYLGIESLGGSGLRRLARNLVPASPEELRLIMHADLYSRGCNTPDQALLESIDGLIGRLTDAMAGIASQAAEPAPLVTSADLMALPDERKHELGIDRPGPRFGALLRQALELQKQGLTASDILSRLA